LHCITFKTPKGETGDKWGEKDAGMTEESMEDRRGEERKRLDRNGEKKQRQADENLVLRPRTPAVICSFSFLYFFPSKLTGNKEPAGGILCRCVHTHSHTYTSRKRAV